MSSVQGLFRESMSRLAGGVAIVTTKVNQRPWGTTISACSSISMGPPLIMVSISNDNVSTESIINEQQFNVHLLSNQQKVISKSGAQPGSPKFFEEYMEKNKYGEYANIKNALANIHCEVYKAIEAGDHTVFIGLVKQVKLGKEHKPLLHFDRTFGTFTSI